MAKTHTSGHKYEVKPIFGQMCFFFYIDICYRFSKKKKKKKKKNIFIFSPFGFFFQIKNYGSVRLKTHNKFLILKRAEQDLSSNYRFLSCKLRGSHVILSFPRLRRERGKTNFELSDILDVSSRLVQLSRENPRGFPKSE